MSVKQNQPAALRVRELLSYARSLDEEADSSHEIEDCDGQAQRLESTAVGIDEINSDTRSLDEDADSSHETEECGDEEQRLESTTVGVDEINLQLMQMNLTHAAEPTPSAHSSECDMSSEFNRLASFKKWPSECPVNPTPLAKAGFFYLGFGDMVQCFSCNGKIYEWEFGDSAIGEHKRFFPNCKFVQGKSQKNQPTMLFPECSLVQSEDVGSEKLTTTDVMNGQHELVHREPSTKLPAVKKNESKNNSQVSQKDKVSDQWSSIPRRRPLTRAQHPQSEAEMLKRFNYWASTAHEAPFPARSTGTARPCVNLDDQPRENEKKPMKNATTTTNLKRNLVKDDEQAKAETKTLNVEGTTSKCTLENVTDFLDETNDEEGPMRKATGTTNLKRKMIEDETQAKAGNHSLECDGLSDEEELMRNATSTTNLKWKLIEDDDHVKTGTKTSIVDGTKSKRKSEEAFFPPWVKQLLEEERNYLKCKICFELDVDVVFIPCQHLVICTQCECPILCPVCKKPIQTCIKGYW